MFPPRKVMAEEWETPLARVMEVVAVAARPQSATMEVQPLAEQAARARRRPYPAPQLPMPVAAVVPDTMARVGPAVALVAAEQDHHLEQPPELLAQPIQAVAAEPEAELLQRRVQHPPAAQAVLASSSLNTLSPSNLS